MKRMDWIVAITLVVLLAGQRLETEPFDTVASTSYTQTETKETERESKGPRFHDRWSDTKGLVPVAA